MRKKRLIDKYNDYWGHFYWSLEDAGCTNPFDKIAVLMMGVLRYMAIGIVYAFLIVTSIVWFPIYGLYCWITERRYKND